mmetsp:Transcript_34208/g.45219  ORF Transcript_34208/g.45219 Transcript_34208/m.45219 type:complete len:541 (+) Transcript_34208:176-1798(+)
MKEINRMTISQALALMQAKSVSPLALTKACVENSKRMVGLNCFTQTRFAEAEQEAEASTERQQSGSHLGFLDGIPIGIKDNLCTQSGNTTAGSKMLASYSSPFNSTPAQKLHQQGTILMGKLNMDEFGMGSANLYSASGPCYNPWSPCFSKDSKEEKPQDTRKLSPGGSSGGSAAAVASGCCLAALGSDTGGSVRQPAAWCGVVGLKPSYGRVSRHGLISYASSLDTVGVLTQSVADAAVMLDAIAGPDPMDSTCIQEPTAPQAFSRSIGISPEEPDGTAIESLKGLKVGVPAEFHVQGMDEEIIDVWENTIDVLKDAGAEIKTVSLPSMPYTLPAYIVLASAEASSNLARYDGVRYGARAKDWHDKDKESAMKGLFGDQSGLHELYTMTRTENFGPEVKRRILSGCFVLSSEAYHDYYELAHWVRARFSQEVKLVFSDQVDVLVSPTAPLLPFEVGDGHELEEDPAVLFQNDVMTVPASLAGIPALSLPAAISTKNCLGTPLPIGMQVMGNFLDECSVLRIAHYLERKLELGKHLLSTS